MTVPQPGPIDEGPSHSHAPSSTFGDRARDFPYWLAVILALLAWMVYSIATNATYNEAYHFIIPGLRTTIAATAFSFLIALAIGLVAGLGRIAKNPVLRNIALTYIEFIRGVPILVLLATVSFVVVPSLSRSFGFENSSISFFWRACIALSVIYGAYLAEVFRAGIESVPPGQMEAGRSLGMSHGQTMRLIVLPQAVRNMTPAIGNDLISMLKDSSLLSFLGINELTQNGRLYTSSTFEYNAGYFILTMLYLILTLVLSLLLRWYRSRLGLDDA
jgi:polar amino acid transport system permease protein